jgi:very-short-patch-repair endonuclease
MSTEENHKNISQRIPVEEFAKQLRENPTSTEYLFSELIRDFNENNKTRYYSQVIISGYVVDFYFPEARIAVEIDGSSHIGKERFDEIRQKAIEDRGVKVLRFSYDEVKLAGYYAKWAERISSKNILKKHNKAVEMRYKIRDLLKDEIRNRIVDWRIE